jgi:single-stranded-DNA-specific exonuclease
VNHDKAEWVIAPRAPAAFFAELSDLHPLTAQTLYARDYHEPAGARAFLNGEVPPVDPFALADMPRAVERIPLAIERGESIAVYGDYDCDGVTACALMMRTLAALGAQAQVYIPNRFDEGYGLNVEALDTLKARGVSLVITVDCGARAMKEALHASEIGLDLIITDHHALEGGAVPSAFAVINPNRPDCPYECKQLAGVGVALRLAQCLIRSKRPPGLTERSLLDYVAIGTVADVVRLTEENRPLVRAGLKQINTSPRAGIAALLRAAGIPPGAVNAGKIGFALGPRLNAAGRLESALAAYDLLMCDDPDRALELALDLNRQNEKRQSVTAQVARDAEARVMAGISEGQLKPHLLFAASTDYNAGVIGLAAARLVEKHYRPAVVVSIGPDGEARGSCRSVNGFDITLALDECRSLLSRYGGHAAAAGFTTRAECLDPLCEQLSAIAERQQPADGWQRALRIDAELDVGALDWQALTELQQLEPHGMGNPKPVFVARGALVRNPRRVGRIEAGQAPPHLQCRLQDARRVVWDAVGWRMGERINELERISGSGGRVDVAFQLDVNEWNGERRMQWVIQDFRIQN